MKFDNFISGEKIQNLCDCCIYNKDYLQSYPNIFYNCKKIILIDGELDNEKIQIINNSKSFFIKTDFLEYFYKIILPNIKKKFILVTHNSDLSSGPINEIQNNIYNNELLVYWYGQNMIPCEKGICIPIGLENSQYKGSDGNFCISNKTNEKNNLLYFNFNVNTNLLRKEFRQSLLNNGFCENNNRYWNNYILELSTYKFCISPPGNGIDCHRTWESIYVGCIPIVLKTKENLMYYYFKNLPILFVDDYNVITVEFLNEQYEIIKNKNIDIDSIGLDYWKNKIENF